jgi:hypothetical protein
MNTRHVTLLLVLAPLLLVACGTASVSSASSPGAAVTAVPSQTAVPAPSGPAITRYTLAPQPGSAVAGFVQVATSTGGVTLTATVSGLSPGGPYLVDADPLPCELFVGGPSQSFAKPLNADAGGMGTVVWTVPSGMNGNVSVQVLTSQGTYAVLACADLA